LKDLLFNFWSFFSEKIFELSGYYGVDPIIFGILYTGTIPILWISIAWIIRNLHRKQPVAIPVTIALLCVTGTYIYIFVVGQNIPVWIYGLAIGMIGFSGYNIHKKVKKGTDDF
jgi:hypothetical protein